MVKMNKQISDEELRMLLRRFDEIDTDLDNMVVDEDIAFSDEHNEKMQNYFKELRSKENEREKVLCLKTKYLKYKMIASIVFLILVGTAIFHIDTLSVYALKIREFVISEFEKYSLLTVDVEEDEIETALDNFELDYESDTFEIEDTIILPDYKIYKYKNPHDDYIKITVSTLGSSELVDTENAEVKEKEIEGVEYQMISKDGIITIYYVQENLLYNIKSNLSEDEIMKEINNIK